jgi:hypothetical protein
LWAVIVWQKALSNLPTSDQDLYVGWFLMDCLPATCDAGRRKVERFDVPS